MRSDYVPPDVTARLRRRLSPANALALDISAATGLRIGDVVSIPTAAMRHADAHRGWLPVLEQKTGRKHSVRVPRVLLDRALCMAGKYFVFEHRSDPTRHRCRNTTWAQLKKITKGYVDHITPHTYRKQYAVRRFRETGGDLNRVQKELGHTNPDTTLIYALSDIVSQGRNTRRKRHRKV